MNIRIPYEKLGDISKYSFVSFILDLKKETIFRYDFINGADDDFFNFKKEYISIEDSLYEMCDSIIFYPFFSEKNDWGTKLLMWKNSEFITMNGGYEFVRNTKTTPDLNKIKTWLDVGKSFKFSKKSIGKKNLIYFTLFHNEEYIKLLIFLLNSLLKQEFKNFELLLITDHFMYEKLKKLELLKKFVWNYKLVKEVSNSVDASMQKLKIFEWENINEYKNILFLDLDILVIGDLSKIFNNKKLKNNIFYGATHNHDQSLHSTVYHSLVDYTTDQLKNFDKNKISAINAGQFFLRNTKTMQKHFENINNFIKIWDGRYFFEQSFINYYFNLLQIADTNTLKREFQFVSINENEYEKKFNKDAVFVHFMGNACNGDGKINFIKKYYGKFL